MNQVALGSVDPIDHVGMVHTLYDFHKIKIRPWDPTIYTTYQAFELSAFFNISISISVEVGYMYQVVLEPIGLEWV